MFPAATGSGESVLVTVTSAAVVTVVIAEAELLVASVSSLVVATVAPLAITVPAARDGATCTVSVTVAEPPGASVPREHVTVAVPEQDPVDGTADTRVVPAGTGSVTVTPSAASEPLFVAVIR